MKKKMLVKALVFIYHQALLAGGLNPEHVPVILERVHSDLSSMLMSDLTAAV